MADDAGFELEVTPQGLRFKTATYIAGEGSALHGNIFNRELVSSLMAGAALVAVAMIAVRMGIKPSLIYALAAIVFFTIVFLLARFFVLMEPVLEAEITADGVTVSSGPRLRKRKRSWPRTGLKHISTAVVIVDPVKNKDGLQVVEKIALQHGMHMDGFGERKEFHTVGLVFENGGSAVLFATLVIAQAGRLVEELTKYTGVGVAQEN